MPAGGPVTSRLGRLLLGSTVLLMLSLVACSTPAADGGPDAGGVQPSVSTPAAATTPPPSAVVLAPLTGVATTAAVAARPTVVVPIAIPSARRPNGLGSADIVYAEWDGAARIRLLALFQSQDNATVGPVAGLAPVDAKLLPLVTPVLAAGPSYAKFSRIAVTAGLNVVSVSRQPSAFQQTSGGTYASTAALRGFAVRGTRAPQNLFPLATPGDPLAGSGLKSVTRLKVPTAARPVFSFAWDPAQKRWRGTVGGAAVSAANVVVLAMPYKRVPVQNRGPEISTADVFGVGNAYAVSGPHGAAGRWARNGPLKLTTIGTPDGVSMRFAPGPTWVILVPEGNGWATT